MSSTYEQKLQMNIPLILVHQSHTIIVRFDLARSMVHGDRRILSRTVEISLMHVLLTEKATVSNSDKTDGVQVFNQLNDLANGKEVCTRICCQLQIITRKLKWFRRTITRKLLQTNITFLTCTKQRQERC